MSDLISRQDAIRAVMTDVRTERTECLIHANMICNRIEKLPSAQPDITDKQIAEYCRKRNLALITHESFETLKAYYDRQNSV